MYFKRVKYLWLGWQTDTIHTTHTHTHSLAPEPDDESSESVLWSSIARIYQYIYYTSDCHKMYAMANSLFFSLHLDSISFTLFFYSFHLISFSHAFCAGTLSLALFSWHALSLSLTNSFSCSFFLALFLSLTNSMCSIVVRIGKMLDHVTQCRLEKCHTRR